MSLRSRIRDLEDRVRHLERAATEYTVKPPEVLPSAVVDVKPDVQLPSTLPEGYLPRLPRGRLRAGERWKWIPAHTTPGRWVITREED